MKRSAADYREILARAYARTLTLEELRSLHAFYVTDAGRASIRFNEDAIAILEGALVAAASSNDSRSTDVWRAVDTGERVRRANAVLMTRLLASSELAIGLKNHPGLQIHELASMAGLVDLAILTATIARLDVQDGGFALLAAQERERLASFHSSMLAIREREAIALAVGVTDPVSADLIKGRIEAKLRELRFGGLRGGVIGCRDGRLKLLVEADLAGLQPLLANPASNSEKLMEIAKHLSTGECLPLDVGRALEIYTKVFEAFVVHSNRSSIVGEGRSNFALALLFATGGVNGLRSVRDLDKAEKLLAYYEKSFQYRARRSVVDSFDEWLYAYETMANAGVARAVCRLAEYWVSGEDVEARPALAGYYERKVRKGCAGTPKRELNLGRDEAVLVKKLGRWYMRYGDGRPDREGMVDVQGGDDF